MQHITCVLHEFELLYCVYTDVAQHDTIQHDPRLHTIIILEVGWVFEQNGGGKNPLAAVSARRFVVPLF